MKTIIGAVVGSILTTTMATAASAQTADSALPTIAGSVSLLTDYRWRGGSLSDLKPAVQGGIGASKDGFYAGAWGSNISFLPSSSIEIDYYGGYSFRMSGSTRIQVQAKYVTFPGARDASLFRGSASLGGNIGHANWGIHADYEPGQKNTLLNGRDNSYIYVDGDVPIANSGLSIAGKVGRENGAFADNKIDWLLGLNKRLLGLNMSLQYVGANKGGRDFKDAALFAVSKSF